MQEQQQSSAKISAVPARMLTQFGAAVQVERAPDSTVYTPVASEQALAYLDGTLPGDFGFGEYYAAASLHMAAAVVTVAREALGLLQLNVPPKSWMHFDHFCFVSSKECKSSHPRCLRTTWRCSTGSHLRVLAVTDPPPQLLLIYSPHQTPSVCWTQSTLAAL